MSSEDSDDTFDLERKPGESVHEYLKRNEGKGLNFEDLVKAWKAENPDAAASPISRPHGIRKKIIIGAICLISLALAFVKFLGGFVEGWPAAITGLLTIPAGIGITAFFIYAIYALAKDKDSERPNIGCMLFFFVSLALVVVSSAWFFVIAPLQDIPYFLDPPTVRVTNLEVDYEVGEEGSVLYSLAGDEADGTHQWFTISQSRYDNWDDSWTWATVTYLPGSRTIIDIKTE